MVGFFKMCCVKQPSNLLFTSSSCVRKKWQDGVASVHAFRHFVQVNQSFFSLSEKQKWVFSTKKGLFSSDQCYPMRGQKNYLVGYIYVPTDTYIYKMESCYSSFTH